MLDNLTLIGSDTLKEVELQQCVQTLDIFCHLRCLSSHLLPVLERKLVIPYYKVFKIVS